MEPLLGTLAELRASVEPRLASMGGDTDNTGLPLGFLSTPWAVGLISLQKTAALRMVVNWLSSQQGYCCCHSVKAQR